MHRSSRSARQGFTLVELLVVMVIIGILAVFLVVGVMAAMRGAREHRIRTELMGLAGAVDNYRNQYGEYPPSDKLELDKHINRLFPRNEDTVDVTGLDEAKMLVYCLAGYSSDPQHPLTGPGATSFFDFDKARIVDDAGEPAGPTVINLRGMKYLPPGTDGILPYVYFRKTWDNTNKVYVWSDSQQFGTDALGYAKSKNISKDFQIISAGLESKYGIEDITSYQDGTEEDEEE